ncbi:MAG: hypothetical protein D8M58_20495 [Calditrichaeota bacterium]|nr:MAG: hypothetical protein DWQ03_00825 [Calditrichota bacterium]MBL1207790.1 hypothetical protein [Calditrichota bacterium]NOG47624.1 hypothetical protein [Calditrichota bacterium]
MQISYIAPLSKAWNRMIKILFKPFYINKWFALGFTAFLAGLLDWADKSSSFEDERDVFDAEEFFSLPEMFDRWYVENAEWFALTIFIIALIVVVVIFLTWLSSRGKFMFLDNVVHNRYLVKKPWADFKKLGNSLFTWRLGYGIILVVLFSGYLSYSYYHVREMYELYASDRELIIEAIKIGVFFVILLIATGYISLFLDDFIVPIMYKNDCQVWIAWTRFMPLFTQNFFYFIIYGLFLFLLISIIVVMVIIGGLLTCCVGFLLIILPYISSIVLLPVSVTLRGLSIDFLEQFGEKYKIFPDEEQLTESS